MKIKTHVPIGQQIRNLEEKVNKTGAEVKELNRLKAVVQAYLKK